ncbi:MAG: Ig domain-containing protein [Clostridiales bacterium]|nr:Ig domain-containing protein [Clostridiales bacterium]
MNRKLAASLMLLVLVGLLAVLPVLSIAAEGTSTAALSLDKVELELAKGKSVKLVATATGEGLPKKLVYKWQSSDKKVATVQAGKVQGIGPGKATITVTLKLDATTELTASCEVTVFVLVTGLTTKTKTLTVNLDAAVQPVITISPKTATNQTLQWTSDNPAVASVNQHGSIKGIKSGECTITAATTDGSNKSISFKVFVPSLSTNVEEVKLTSPFRSTPFGIRYDGRKSNITIDDKNASNNIYFYEIDDNRIQIRVWPWGTGTSTLTITDSASPKSTLKIKIITSADAGINSRTAFPNLTRDYKELMRYGPSSYADDYYFVEARVMQAYQDSTDAWFLAYSKGKYDNLIYVKYPTARAEKHDWFKDDSVRLQEDDVIYILAKAIDVYSYQTTMGATNYALQLKPMLMHFKGGEYFYLDKYIYK